MTETLPRAAGPVSPPAGQTRRIVSWSLYDWANSAFTTIVVTFVYSTYFTEAFAADPDTGTAYWSRAVAISAIVIALLSPVVGAMADRGGRRRSFLVFSTLGCVGATAALAFVSPGMEHSVLLALTIFVVANVAFEVGGVFYNSFLPDVAPEGKIGTISGLGWGVGYTAGIVSMVLALFAFVGFGGGEAWLGLSTDQGWNIRAVNLLVAGWFLVFSIPMFIWVKDDGEPKAGVRVSEAFAEVRRTFGEIGEFRQTVRFLLARLLYNDGLVTIFAFGGIYAQGTFGFTMAEVIVFGIVLNIVAGLGAFVFGFFDDRVGGKNTVMISLVCLGVAALLGVFAPNRLWFWVAGIGIGMFAGPNQAASRSLMGRFVPDQKQAEFFGFFQFSGKITAFIGPFLLGVLSDAFNNQRPGVAVVVLLFLAGGLVLSRVDEAEGIRAARLASV